MFSFSLLSSIRLFAVWWWLCSAVFTPTTTLAQKPRQQQQQLQPLGDVLLLVLDQDKDQKVTQDEVNNQMKILEQLFSGGDDESKEYLAMLEGAKAVAPYLFELLDSNGDKVLSKKELTYFTKFERSLTSKTKSFKDFVRASFEILDSNGDDELSPEEIVASSEEEKMLKIATEFHKLFPLRGTAEELVVFVRRIVSSIGGGDDSVAWNVDTVKVGMKWLDTDHDGLVQRKEVGKAYNDAGKKFKEVAKTIKQMGPMMALFGGADFGGGGGNSGFKREF